MESEESEEGSEPEMPCISFPNPKKSLKENMGRSRSVETMKGSEGRTVKFKEVKENWESGTGFLPGEG